MIRDYDYGSGNLQAKAEATMTPRAYTLRERMTERKEQAEKHLNDINEALKFLDANPSFEAFHNLIGKAGF